MVDHMRTYPYSDDLIWKYDILEHIFKAYNEPMLNLQFLGPYLKNSSASENVYDMIFSLMRIVSDKNRSMVFDNLKMEIEEFKQDILDKKEKEEEDQNLVLLQNNKILVLFHLMIQMCLKF